MLVASATETMALLDYFASLWQMVFKGTLWSFSVAWHIRHLKSTLSGAFIGQLPVLVYWEREATVMALPSSHDSAV